MKKFLGLLVLCALINPIGAQNKISVKETKIDINTIDASTVSVKLMLKLPEGSRHREVVFKTNNPGVKFNINSITQKELVAETESEEELIYSNSFVGFRFESGNELMTRIIQGKADFFIEVSDTMHLQIVNDNKKDTVMYILTPEQVKEYTRNKLILTEEQKKELIQSAGGEINIAGNNLDVGFVPEEESNSGRTEYRISFNYKSKYDFIQNSPVFFQASGLFSTNFRDSLNYIFFSPIGYCLVTEKSEFACQVGFEADQVFSYCRLTGNLHWEGILPNLVDFTYGSNRLRLKPIMEAGLKIYHEIRNDRKNTGDEKTFPGIAYTQLYYYIPVSKMYSLELEGKVFYDFNIQNNPNKKIKGLYSITFGLEIPNTGIQTIFKYSNGETDVRYASTSTLLIGLTADLFAGLIKK
jgi:hypothetical protein